MNRRRDRLGYRGDAIPSPLGLPTTAERLAIVEGTAALGRELTAAESKCCIACAHLFSSHIMTQDEQIQELQAKLLEIHRRWA